MITFSFTLDSRLHAHPNGHWRSKSEPTKQMREYAYLVAKSGDSDPLRGPVVVSYRFLVPDRKRRDIANLIQSCKPIIDGICDAGIVEGDHWEVMSIGEVTVNVSPIKSKSVRVQIEIESKPEAV